MLPSVVDPEDFVEYLHRCMRVQRASDVGDM